ncbi:HamA C-terminal domain-containing protein [Anaerotignum sp. MB30-C6]|uniref:HamA C-terminal domain-containing protein n=1 Tax=Anaerotignum sp. MB30-C6 TaxID=3070814 RepID=UPI0027DD2D71|nr:DUF1837 domain-containing protein [Anaerotignum sp. MB30-C6]WMI82113.1 DUF1837 domain-containing protein [Anaerotignum sp. MB30-C6]
MELSIQDQSFLDSFEHIKEYDIDEYNKNKLNLFMIRVNANEFDYNTLIYNLLDTVISFSVSRNVQTKYVNKPARLHKKAVDKFVEHCRNTGELGELLLYAFLECHLKAPKILSKLELKTSTSMYVNGADGVHYLELPNGNYQLIFGESKTIKGLSDAISSAFKSIYEFKNEINSKGNAKSGINYEKSLISDNIMKETFNKNDIDFITKLIYPSKNSDFRVDDAFGIFIGYEVEILKEDKKLPNDEFVDKLKTKIEEEVEENIEKIIKAIDENDLIGHSFYVYVLPFTNLDASRKKVMEGVT